MSPLPELARTVHKFGGASLGDGTRVRRVGEILRERALERPIAVVSAAFGVTSMLDALARDAAAGQFDATPVRLRHRGLLAQLALDAELCNRYLAELAAVLASIQRRGQLTPPERDHVLSFGERIAARIVAAHLNSIQVRALPIDAFNLGLVSDSNHGRASIVSASAERVRSALAGLDAVPVITGFVAADARGNLTTLGRNGSDLSAALIAEAIGAREVVFWKDVEGVLSADPKLVPSAHVVRELGYDEAAELTRHGASVLHADAVAPLARAGLRARVACVREPADPGTLIHAAQHGPRPLGVACRAGLALYVVRGEIDERSVLDLLGEARVEPLHVETSEGSIAIVAPASHELARTWLALGADASIEHDLAAVAAVGSSRDAALVRAALREAHLSPRAEWSSREHGTRVFVVAEDELARTANVVHEWMFETTVVSKERR